MTGIPVALKTVVFASEWRFLMDAQKILEKIYEFGASFGLKIVATLLILIVGLKLSKWIVKIIANSKGFSRLELSLQSFIKSFISVALNAFVIVTAAITIGIPAASFITLLASAAAAIGLALQGSLSNFAGGIMLLIFKPFEIGDYVDVNGQSGTVKGISVFYTTLTTIDNKVVTIPNGALTNNSIVNYSANDTRRVDLTFSVSYSSDTDKVKSILFEQAKAQGKVLSEPKTEVYMTAHADSSVNFVLRAWCKTEDYWEVFYSLTENVKKAFDSNGIEIPFPQLDVHLEKQA
jgi:small conductance mechanosensitive channel